MKRSLVWRITIPIIILVIIGMAFSGIYQANSTKEIYITGVVDSLRTDSKVLIGLVEGDLQSPSADLSKTVDSYSKTFGARVTIINTEGVVLADSEADQSQMENHLARPEIMLALGGKEGVEIRYSKTLNIDMLYVAEPVAVSDKVVGVIRLSVPMNQLKTITGQIVRSIVLRGVLVTGLIILLAYFVISRSLRPLHDLTNAARSVSSGNYTVSPIHDTGDELGLLSAAFHQMTKKIQSDISELEMQADKLNAVLARMSDGVIITDGAGKVTLINEAAQTIFHADRVNVPGTSLAEIVRHYQVIQLWEKCAASCKAQTTVLDLSKDRLFIQCIVIPPDDSESGFFLCLFQDLTKLRRLEMVRQDFVSNVSHELRTPLASMKAIAETLQEGAMDDKDNAKRFLTNMEIEIDHMTQLVNELMDLARLESGTVQMNFESHDIQDLVGRVVERMQMQAKRAGLSISKKLEKGLPKIELDGRMIEQVLINLIHNAIKFTPPDGSISITVKKQGDAVNFAIHDTGSGIEPELLGRIFERFYKTDKARATSGTGLGLSIARHAVEAHGGKIWAESKPGEGSTFYFLLPITQRPLSNNL